MKRFTLTLALTLAAPLAAAQTVSLTLPDAVSRALASGPDVTTARANLQKAQATLKATQADPSAIITTLTQAQQGAAAADATLAGTKMNVAQTVITQYMAAYEAAGRITLNEAQVALDERNLQIAQARLRARVATPLDVNRAQTSLNQNRQELADARAQLPVLEAQLARTLGLNVGTDLKLAAPPGPPKLSVTLAGLQNGLEKRLPTLVQAAQGAEFAALQVRISDNDYTPARTLQDAQTALANARRDLEGAQRGASTQVRDAYRAVQDAQQKVDLARQQAANAQTTLTQAQARLKAGTAAAVEVQQAQVQAQQASFGVTQAQDNLWRALAALSAASGNDVTGLVG
ncbi:TolC family protein [Deinococcus metallilatus]|uniref:Outer membrane protein TolC n=1 Tax=Deinococcus metallilatus TaxID=1211322 RepID=A0AAJ5F5T9_9DEIO|nr:TolC family protein [Deinococcus metallilatus]MBB5296303.1 outer membrane protein TolC [Deinococcus metallilatus]QBY10013.1 TolC family protein [Deinococcus metallilatus]RXJ08737.1 TolC family protein [Deinococcus metallilatus]TLK25211.1 TolC family protein [Deinococcus metallilatus]GMA14785.1 transporter [Deinococcus metallilatus]